MVEIFVKYNASTIDIRMVHIGSYESIFGIVPFVDIVDIEIFNGNIGILMIQDLNKTNHMLES